MQTNFLKVGDTDNFYFALVLIVRGPALHCATSRTVLVSIPGGVTGDFFRGSPRQNNVPRGEFRPRQTRQLLRAADLKGRLLSCQSY